MGTLKAPLSFEIIFNPYSFLPTWLLWENIRRHLWLTILLLLPGLLTWFGVGRNLGFPFLFLEPEYLNKTNFLSFFIVGLFKGWLLLAWHMALFILYYEELNFLVISKRPFAVFMLNNSVIPFIYVLVSTAYLVNFHLSQGHSWTVIGEYVFGFLSGILLSTLIGFVLFLRKKAPPSGFRTHREKPTVEPLRIKGTYGPSEIPLSDHVPVKYFLGLRFTIRFARSVHHYDRNISKYILQRSHFGIMMFFLISLIVIFILGRVGPVQILNLPAAASIFLFLAILIMLFGAIAFWAGKWRQVASVVAFASLLIFINYYTPGSPFRGLDYSQKVPITDSNNNHEHFQSRRKAYLSFLNMLENWHTKQRRLFGDPRPPLVIVCVSGGGLRAALWTFTVLQRLDSLSGGTFKHRVFMITGASGGMLGAAYFRALQLRFKSDEQFLYSKTHRERIARDLLNSVIFTMAAHDLLTPYRRKIIIDDKQYYYDRGIAFEENLNHNTFGVLDVALGKLFNAEHSQEIPTMIFSPVVLGNGKFLTISTHSLSFLADTLLGYAPDIVDVHELLGSEAKNINLLSAIRSSASFPIIMPTMELPTDPTIAVTDAGVRDNFGTEMALEILYHFRDWINSRTSGVIIIMVRDLPLNINYPIKQSLFTRGMMFSLMAIQNHRQKMLLGLATKWFAGRFKVFHFIYERPWEERASLSWHLTFKEKNDIIAESYSQKFKIQWKNLSSELR
ncbi:MAG: hypothetical protein GXO48_05090 [Chlorobi bacterium]|nr:hypothetical protein [Chlorobiota bacterium]